MKIDGPPGGIQTSETSLHEAHDVCRRHLTRRRGEMGTRRSFSLLLRFCASPSPRVAAFLSLRISVSLGFGQASLGRKKDVEARALRKSPQNFVSHGFRRILVDFAPTLAAIGYSNSSVEKAKVVEDFSLSADGRARVSS